MPPSLAALLLSPDRRRLGGDAPAAALDDDRGCRLASADARFGWTKRKHDLAHVRRADVVQLDSGPARLLSTQHRLHAIDGGWTRDNPVRKASRPRRKRAGDIEPDLQFLSVPELEAVLRAIPSDIVRRQPAPTRREAPARPHPRRRTSSDQYPASSSPRP